MKVLFICVRNICRSPLAQALFEKWVGEMGLDVTAESCGTWGWHVGEQVDARMRQVAEFRGISIDHIAQKFRSFYVEEYDLLIPMDYASLRDLGGFIRTPEQEKKVALLRQWDPQRDSDEVPDPYYGGRETLEEVFNIVDRSCKALAEDLAARSS